MVADGGGGMERWISHEMIRLQTAFVSQPRPLGDLVLEETPAAPTKGGQPHVFDKEVLRRFHEALGPLDRRRLRLPITFYVDKDLPADAYVVDAVAVRLLRTLGDLGDQEMRDGRLWMGHARARAIAERYATAFQFVHQ